MNNRDLEATWSYHDGTKHSLWSIHNDLHYLDSEIQPLPFKIYSDLEPIPLPDDLPPSGWGLYPRPLIWGPALMATVFPIWPA